MDNFWEEGVRLPVKFESNLNFTTVSASDDDDFTFNKKKMARDPLSHRIIEKRRRDRMNNCLADLSRLIPAEYLTKARGRIEKTEIIEMAIRHMKHLQQAAAGGSEGQGSPPLPVPRAGGGCAPINTEHFRLGYQECMSEAMHFLVEVQGCFPGEPLCVQLVGHLKNHCDRIATAGEPLDCPGSRGSVTSTTSTTGTTGTTGSEGSPSCSSSSSSSEGRPPPPPPPALHPAAAASLYKFKNTIEQRFLRDGDGDGDAPAPKRRRREAASPPLGGAERSGEVPVFALHARGAYYVPLSVGEDALGAHLDELTGGDDAVLHPVTISVSFKHGAPTHPL